MLFALFLSANLGFVFFFISSKATSSPNIRCRFILFLLLANIAGLSPSQTGHVGPAHSNFFRSTLRGRHRVLPCGSDPTVCADPDKNPWGGTTCCFQKFCKDIGSDNNHCGACGHACGYGRVCCDGKCVDIQNDPRHCGTCFEVCQSRCVYALCDYSG